MKRDPVELAEALEHTYATWNNPPSDGLPEGAGSLLEAAQALRDMGKALEKALDGLDAGCLQYASRTEFGREIPGDEQYPWVRKMQIGRDAARAALSPKGGEYG